MRKPEEKIVDQHREALLRQWEQVTLKKSETQQGTDTTTTPRKSAAWRGCRSFSATWKNQ
jgi:hypothetical protein